MLLGVQRDLTVMGFKLVLSINNEITNGMY